MTGPTPAPATPTPATPTPAAGSPTPGTSAPGTPDPAAAGGGDVIAGAAAAAHPAPGAPAPSLAGEPAKAADAIALKLEDLKVPDGFKPADGLLKEFHDAFTGDKSPSERANALLGLHAKALKEASEAGSKLWEKTNADWVAEVKADPVIGGANLEPTRQMISKAIDSLGAEATAFRQALDATGAGNHPAIIRALAKWSKSLTEGGVIPGSTPPSRPRSAAEAFYPNMKTG